MQVSSGLSCRRSSRLVARYPEMRFSAVLLTDLDLRQFNEAVGQFADYVTQSFLHGGPSVKECLTAYEAFFAERGKRFPLVNQIASAAKRGFPPVPPQILALLALEAATGVLMGVQNLDAIREHLELDALDGVEEFVGMRGEPVKCAPGEIVVRDAEGIVASLFQGPDARTATQPGSNNLVFYVFDAEPTLGVKHDEAVDMVSRLVPKEASRSIVILRAS